VGLYLAVVQFFLAIGWVVYAAYLPQLAKAAGLPPKAVPWLLMADQLVFIATDLAVGLASDHAARVLAASAAGCCWPRCCPVRPSWHCPGWRAWAHRRCWWA